MQHDPEPPISTGGSAGLSLSSSLSAHLSLSLPLAPSSPLSLSTSPRLLVAPCGSTVQGYEGTSRTCSTTLTSLSRSPAADCRSSSALHRVFDELHYRPPSSTVTGLVKSDCSTVVLPLQVLKLDPLVQRAFAAALAVKDLQGFLIRGFLVAQVLQHFRIFLLIYLLKLVTEYKQQKRN